MATRKVVYLLPRLNLAETSLLGVKKKVFGQLKAFENSGFEAVLIDTPEVASTQHTDNSSERREPSNFIKSVLKWPWDRSKGLLRNARNVRGVLSKVRSVDNTVVYVRHTRTSPGLLLFYFALNRLSNVERIYLEIPTWPFKHEGLSSTLDHLLWPLIRFWIQRVVTFSAAKNILGLKTINITNGVSAEENPLHDPPASDNETFKLVFVGQMYPWSGLDRLFRGIATYAGQGAAHGPVKLRIAGAGKMLADWQQLVSSLEIEDKVAFHEICSGDRLDKLYDGSHLAIGNLANHRRKLDSNADLKNREYCMRGIPFVTASEDPAFPCSFEYRMKVPSDDAELDVGELIRFYRALQQEKPKYAQRMREYAERYLQWTTTMAPVIQDMRESGE